MSDEKLTIRIRENGPLVLPAKFIIVDHLGNPFPLPAGKENVALCRCGQSKVKPFCDGTHRECGFKGAEIAPTPTA
ncbi:MAG TPA: CDGSH iron-sulfur domain-containing protein [Gemmataceae bacterium]|nr:CDGSH iron-sulfur domain-containing protein [Gemmataceae bacterium]